MEVKDSPSVNRLDNDSASASEIEKPLKKQKMEWKLDISSEEKRQELKKRARKLAEEPPQETDGEEYLEALEFSLANERYAIETVFISEVYPLKELTSLPCVPAFFLGIINVRGRIVTVIDLKRFFELPEKGITELNKIVIVESDNMELGVLADEIKGIVSIPMSGLQPAIPTLTGIREDYLKVLLQADWWC